LKTKNNKKTNNDTLQNLINGLSDSKAAVCGQSQPSMPPIICNINNAIKPIRKSQKCLLKSFCVCVFIRTFHCYYPHACVDSWLVRELRDPATQIHLCGGLWQIARRIESKRIEFDLTTASAHKTTIADHFLIKSLNLITTCLRNEWPYRMPLT